MFYFPRFKQDQIKVKVGEYNFNEAGDTLDSTYALASMKYHENYNTKTFENDIAVLKLERPVTFSRSVYPICLPPSGELYSNKRAFVIGGLLNITKTDQNSKFDFEFWLYSKFEI